MYTNISSITNTEEDMYTNILSIKNTEEDMYTNILSIFTDLKTKCFTVSFISETATITSATTAKAATATRKMFITYIPPHRWHSSIQNTMECFFKVC